MRSFGNYDVVVSGAGVTGIVAAIAASRKGARTLLLDGSGLLGGLITGGRLTKPQGVVQPGVYLELLRRAAAYGGARPEIRTAELSAYSGIFDAETMQRAVVELLDESGVDVLLYAQVVDVMRDADRVVGLELHTKAGPGFVMGQVTIDATGDGDVAALAGAEFMFGREEDGLVQPMTSYFRILNVDMHELAADAAASQDDLYSLELPENWSNANAHIDYTMSLYMRGFEKRIAKARADGFKWILPQDMLVIKSGRLAGEVNINACRVHGNGLDPWERSNAVIELRKQAYCVVDFLRDHVGGFKDAAILDVSPVLGVRETRRIVGEYVISSEDVRNEARFEDAVGLCIVPIDIHEPGGKSMIIEPTGNGYGMPFRALVPKNVSGLLMAGRCLSADHVAFGSTRQTPACAISGQAAGIGAALAAEDGAETSSLDIQLLQKELRHIGVVLGTDASVGLRDVSEAVGNF